MITLAYTMPHFNKYSVQQKFQALLFHAVSTITRNE